MRLFSELKDSLSKIKKLLSKIKWPFILLISLNLLSLQRVNTLIRIDYVHSNIRV